MLELRQLETSNHLIGDRKALDAEFEKNGCWVFENVLDIEAVKDLRQKYIEVLEEHDLVERGDDTLEYTGNPVPPGAFRPKDREIYKSFINNPKIKGAVEKIIGEEIIWVPIRDYKVITPLGRIPDDQRAFWHTDGHYNPGLPFTSIWIPLNDMDEENGGLAVRPGLHNGPSLYPESENPDSFGLITLMPHDHELLDESVSTYPFRLGDAVIFDRRTPHSGLHNLSSRFRMSFDVRFVRASDNVPLVGTLVAVEDGQIKVKSEEDSHIETLAISADTYFRENVSRYSIDRFEETFPIGTEVIVARVDGLATTVTHVWPPADKDVWPTKRDTYA